MHKTGVRQHQSALSGAESLYSLHCALNAQEYSLAPFLEEVLPSTSHWQLRNRLGGFYSNNWGGDPAPQLGCDNHRAEETPLNTWYRLWSLQYQSHAHLGDNSQHTEERCGKIRNKNSLCTKMLDSHRLHRDTPT